MRTAAQKAAWRKLPSYVKYYIKKQPVSVWAKRIKREYDYKCAQCGSESSLEAHHIYFKSLHPSRIEDLDNGLCLCTKCHDVIHSLFIQSQTSYYDLVNLLVIKRLPMKSISTKKRNPSTFNYNEAYSVKEPEQAITIEETPETKRLMKSKKTKKKENETGSAPKKKMPYKKSKKKIVPEAKETPPVPNPKRKPKKKSEPE